MRAKSLFATAALGSLVVWGMNQQEPLTIEEKARAVQAERDIIENSCHQWAKRATNSTEWDTHMSHAVAGCQTARFAFHAVYQENKTGALDRWNQLKSSGSEAAYFANQYKYGQ